MATIVRPKDERPRKRSRRQEAGCVEAPRSIPKAEPAGKVTEKELWQLRQQIAGALNRIDELEAQVLILARGGKEKEFYSVEEAAQIWGVSKSNLYLMIRQGRLPAIKIGETVRIARGTLITGPTE